LGIDARPLYTFSLDAIIPAVGQGALALQGRANDDVTRRLLARLEDPEARATVEAERAFLHALGGDCNVPLAGHARIDGSSRRLRFDALVGSTDQGACLKASIELALPELEGDLIGAARGVGQAAAAALRDQGAAALIEQARRVASPTRDPRSRPAR
jgi:hydroxymethylbilane synthase